MNRQKTDSGRERGAMEPTLESNFPATPGPGSFTVLIAQKWGDESSGH